MKYHVLSLVTFWIAVSSAPSVTAFVPLRHQARPPTAVLNGVVVVETGVEMNVESLTNELISKLRFRAVRRELERRALDTGGTFSAMKNRLREAVLGLKPTSNSIGDEESTLKISRDVLDEVRTQLHRLRGMFLCYLATHHTNTLFNFTFRP